MMSHGAVLDVVIDLRKGNPSFGNYGEEMLLAENKQPLWIPQGWAIGPL